jgi:hypothetical protein
MSCAKLIVLVAVAVLFAQLQCAAACAEQLCVADFSGSAFVTPCHRHPDHSHGQTPAPCARGIIDVPATSPQTPHAEAPNLGVLGGATSPPAVAPAAEWVSAFGYSVLSLPELEEAFLPSVPSHLSFS